MIDTIHATATIPAPPIQVNAKQHAALQKWLDLLDMPRPESLQFIVHLHIKDGREVWQIDVQAVNEYGMHEATLTEDGLRILLGHLE